ncbi:MAG: sugar phosphate isomerase/epimerase [Bryobacteraceae bacterium]
MGSLNRREFLGTVAATAAASGKARKVTMAAHVWVYAATLPEYDVTPLLDQIFGDLRYAGIDAVELMEVVMRRDGAVQRIREVSKKHDLPVIGMSYNAPMWDRDRHPVILKEAPMLIGRLSEVGGRELGLTVGDARRQKTAQELDAQAEILRKIMAICKENGVVANLHNHIFEVANSEYDLKGTLARVPDVKLGPDFDWLVGAKVDPVDFIHRYGNRIVYGHIRDRRKDGVWVEAVGEGDTNLAAIGRALHEIHFAGDLAIELAHPNNFKLTRPLRESFKISRDYVRRVMGY